MAIKKSYHTWKNAYTDDLFSAILKLQNLEEAQNFFRDLLTEKEIVEFGQRWRVAQMLNNGISYSKIEAATGMSSTTVARIHKWLKNGMGGYKNMLSKST